MAQAGEQSLAELIAREQRSLRRLLIASAITVAAMALMIVAFGIYLYAASQNLAQTTQTLQRQTFETRRNVDAQNNRILAQEVAIRRAYDEIRLAGGDADIAATQQNIEAARASAESFILRGRIPSLDEQRVLAALGQSAAVSMEMRALLAAVSSLVTYDTRAEEIVAGATELPPRLNEVVDNFETARGDPALSPLANAGIAWVMFEDASSPRRNYSIQACNQVFNAVAASATGEHGIGPQPLFWRAQCERKLGMTGPALADYAQMLAATPGPAAARNPDPAELTLAMNALHGVGTTLIASAVIPDSAPGMAEALGIAGEACPVRHGYRDRSPRMALALSCLSEAVLLRRVLGQTQNLQSASGENMSFAHLRDGDFNAAYANAVAVERTGLFPWNEVVRALSAERARLDAPEARRAAAVAEADARGNIALFNVDQFNLCELQALFDPEMYEEVREIIADAHPGEEVACQPAG